MRKPRLGRITGIALVLAFFLIAHPANAQFSNATGKVAGTAGQACVSATNDYAWPDTNGNILKCVSNVWTIQGVTASAAGSTGYVQFNNGGALGADSNFFWDNTNKRVGIGTATPATSLDLSANSDGLKLQTIAAASGASCTSTYTGAIRYNSTGNNIEFCDGTNWRYFAASTTSCGSPSGLSFTNLTGQSLSTSVNTLSNPATITFSGCSGGGLSVSVSGAATAQISINGGGWVTSGAITSGQTLNVRMTTSGSASTVLTATVTVGGSSTNWTTTTRAGSLKVFVTSAAYLGSGIGGLAGADALCQSAAGSNGYAGTYKAILSDETTSALSRLTLSYPIVRATDGTVVASINLFSGTLDNPICASSCPGAWTGMTPAGGISTGYTCSSWTSSSNTGRYGVSNGTNGAVTPYGGSWVDSESYGASQACNMTMNLYCIQQ